MKKRGPLRKKNMMKKASENNNEWDKKNSNRDETKDTVKKLGRLWSLDSSSKKGINDTWKEKKSAVNFYIQNDQSISQCFPEKNLWKLASSSERENNFLLYLFVVYDNSSQSGWRRDTLIPCQMFLRKAFSAGKGQRPFFSGPLAPWGSILQIVKAAGEEGGRRAKRPGKVRQDETKAAFYHRSSSCLWCIGLCAELAGMRKKDQGFCLLQWQMQKSRPRKKGLWSTRPLSTFHWSSFNRKGHYPIILTDALFGVWSRAIVTRKKA